MSTQTCTDCHVRKPLEDFGVRVKDSQGGKKGEPTALCLACTVKASQRRKDRKRKFIAEADSKDTHGVDEGGVGDLDIISFSDLVNILQRSEFPLHIQGRVDVTLTAPLDLDGRKRADCVAVVLGEYTNLHWT